MMIFIYRSNLLQPIDHNISDTTFDEAFDQLPVTATRRDVIIVAIKNDSSIKRLKEIKVSL